MGLSTAHNGPQIADEAWGHVQAYSGGNLVKLRFQGLAPLPGGGSNGGGLRGKVQTFSRGSRRRLMSCIASINRCATTAKPVFATLTYPASWPTEAQAWKKHLRAFIKRLTRFVGPHAIVWRLEFQRRGAPHFHLVVWGLRETPGLRDWVSQAWYEVVGSGDERHLKAGTNVQRAESYRQMWAYLAKYVAKEEDASLEREECVGRLWGVENRSLLPVEPVSYLVAFSEALKLRRVLRRVACRRKGSRRGIHGATAFLESSTLARWLDLFAPDASSWQGTGPDPPGDVCARVSLAL